jgi:hypothetical protein
MTYLQLYGRSYQKLTRKSIVSYFRILFDSYSKNTDDLLGEVVVGYVLNRSPEFGFGRSIRVRNVTLPKIGRH